MMNPDNPDIIISLKEAEKILTKEAYIKVENAFRFFKDRNDKRGMIKFLNKFLYKKK